MEENILNNIICKKFSEIDLHDPFFDSLKRDYPGFDDWFGRKKMSLHLRSMKMQT